MMGRKGDGGEEGRWWGGREMVPYRRGLVN